MTKNVLSRLLGAEIAESRIFQEAVTHRSAGVRNNERLEFLGDAILGLLIADYLYTRFPDAKEGELSRLRSHLVRKETLAKIAKEIHLGELVRLGPGELKSGGQQRETILADALEAVFASVYILKGLAETQQLAREIFRSRLDTLPSPIALKDPKSRLQELLQSKNFGLPKYDVVEAKGESHAQEFESRCVVADLSIETTAWGNSKRKAEQACAQKVLDIIQDRRLVDDSAV